MIRPHKQGIPEYLLHQVPLGKPRQYFTTNPISPKLLVFIGGALIVVGVLTIGYSFVVFIRNWMSSNTFPIWDYNWLIEGLGVTSLLSGILIYISVKRQQNLAVMIYEHGVTIIGAKLIYNWKWSDIAELFEDRSELKIFGTKVFSRNKCTLVDQHNHQIVINGSIAGFDQILVIIKSKVCPLLLRAGLWKYQNSQTIQFGILSISHENGITFNDEEINWDVISDIEVVQGYLKISRNARGKKTHLIPIRSIANLEVLLAIAKSQIEGRNYSNRQDYTDERPM